MSKLEIIATINTHKITRAFLRQLVENGATIMRMNGAHVRPPDIPKAVGLIREHCGRDAKILVDLPGNKIRTSGLLQNVALKNGETFELESRNFSYPGFIDYLKAGDAVTSSDGQLSMAVEKVHADRVSFTALCDGELLNNKGLHLPAKSLAHLPFLFDRDREILKHALPCDIDYAGFSFIRTPENVDEAHSVLAGSAMTPIIKLETKEGTEPAALDAILKRASTFLIDRGDLASEVGMTRFPMTFNRTLAKALASGGKVFVATQLFASMYEHNLPHLSEVMEFHRLARTGIVGIQLSEEIAIGKHPLEVLKIIAALSGEAA